MYIHTYITFIHTDIRTYIRINIICIYERPHVLPDVCYIAFEPLKCYSSEVLKLEFM